MQEELTHMIDQVTTNKTDFFREPTHFDYLSRKVLPELASRQKTITVWSAGCSTGEEPYTLAMVLKEFTRNHPGTDFIVLATDISTRVLEKARLAVYDEETVAPVPAETKRRCLLRGKGKAKQCYRVKPELRRHVQFEYLNLMDSDFALVEQMDIIFCRNVIIYFDKSTQGALLHRFCRHLSPHGHLFMGHSETLFGMDLPLKQVAPTVYRRIQ
jgi:chemotaxis protein methyltransferase CheR